MIKREHIQMLTADAVELLKGMVAVPSPSFSESRFIHAETKAS